jgi:hypothetical protein
VGPPELRRIELSSGNDAVISKRFPNNNIVRPPSPLPPAADGTPRPLPVLARPPLTVGSHSQRTSKYTVLTFLPRVMYEQARRVANIYFGLISALQART